MLLTQLRKRQMDAGVLVVDNQMRMVSLNRKFIDMWHIPKELIALQDDNLTLEFVSNQFVSPKEFLQKVQYFYSRPNDYLHDFLTLKNGQLFERFSCPQWALGKRVGRLWIFFECNNYAVPNRGKAGAKNNFSVLEQSFPSTPDPESSQIDRYQVSRS